MVHFDVNTIVTRVTPGKEAGLFLLQELETGDEFTYEEERYALVTERVSFDSCSTGDRVRYGGSWYIVVHHGMENVLLPLVPNKPFSVKTGTNHGTFPFPTAKVEVLTFEEVTKEGVPA